MHMLRRRSVLLKIVFLVCTVWLTVAFLLFTEQRNSNSYDSNGEEFLKGGGSGVGGEPGHNPNGREVLGVPQPLQRLMPVQQEQIVSKSLRNNVPGMGPEEGEGGVLPPPRDNVIGGAPLYGEMGKPVVLPANMTSEVKKLVDEGWQKNAFNQYVSDLISLHRKLPDPRDEW